MQSEVQVSKHERTGRGGWGGGGAAPLVGKKIVLFG